MTEIIDGEGLAGAEQFRGQIVFKRFMDDARHAVHPEEAIRAGAVAMREGHAVRIHPPNFAGEHDAY